MRDTPPLLDACARVYWALLWALPAPLREARRTEMVELFRDLYSDGYHRAGARGALVVFARSCAGLTRAALMDRLPRGARRRGRVDGDPMLSSILADMRLAARTLRRTPGFTLVSVVTLALGIGATTAIFSVVYGVVIRDLPYDAADELVYIDHKAPAVGFESGFGSAPGLYWHYSQHADTLDQIAYWEAYDVTVTGDGVDPVRVAAADTTSEMFTVLRIRPLHGRLFRSSDHLPGSEPAVILSHRFWQQRFGGDPAAVGLGMLISGRRYAIVGVLPPGFRFTNAELYLNNRTDFPNRFVAFNGYTIARLKSGTSVATVRGELDGLLTQMDRTFAEAGVGQFMREAAVGSIPTPLKDAMIGPVKRVLWVLLATVGFVLLIACANVANLVLVRAEARQREVAVRYALGASRAQVLRSFLAEGLVLSFGGCAAGLVIAKASVDLLVARIPFDLPRADEVGINFVVLAFAASVAMGCGFVFALIPALRGVGELNDILRDSGRTTTVGGARVRTRQALVVAQIALSLILLNGAGLMARSFAQLVAVDPGIAADNVLTYQLFLPRSRYDGDMKAATFHDQVLEGLSALPGVTNVGAVRELPLSGRGGGYSLIKENDNPTEGDVRPLIMVSRVAPGYFTTLGIPLIAGRTIVRADQDEARPAIVINQAAADIFFRGEDPVGQRVSTAGDRRWLEVVGVVGTTKQVDLTESPTPVAFVTMVEERFNSSRQMSYVVRVDGDPLAIADGVRAVVHAADRDLPIVHMRSMARILSAAGAPMAFTTLLLGIAAELAVLLASIGVYGVTSFIVGHRKGEIGIRMALGAAAPDVRRILLRTGAVVGAVGLGIGFGVSLVLGQTMGALLYEVDPLDPSTHLGTSLLLCGVVFLATWIPALRASRIDAVVALRAD